jgi:hypothetical protein
MGRIHPHYIQATIGEYMVKEEKLSHLEIVISHETQGLISGALE